MPNPAVRDASGLYEVERRAYHAARSGFRIAELQISPTQKVPWHSHSNVQDTFYVIEGELRLFMKEPELDFGRFRRREREHFPCAARYGTEFLCCLGLAGT
jgi:mannose-6-phosphate isomerase-like protein (cupin superfamily)